MQDSPVADGTSLETASPHIVPCNFRSAGRLSNESIRQLRTMHDGFARNLAHALDLFLGSPLDIKMIGVEQMGSREFATSLTPGSYLVPFTLVPVQSRILVRLDATLFFPLLDLLLGGPGDPVDTVRELTEIDEELIHSVTELIGAQLERAWKGCDVSAMPSPAVKPALAGQFFAAEERIVSIHFEIALGQTRAGMRLILPMAFCNALVRSNGTGSALHGREARTPQPLRERVLDCNFTLSAELPELSISVGDLIAMEPGTVLDLHAPVNASVRLSVQGYPLFEMTPVRRGGRKTAQVGAPCHKALGA